MIYRVLQHIPHNTRLHSNKLYFNNLIYYDMISYNNHAHGCLDDMAVWMICMICDLVHYIVLKLKCYATMTSHFHPNNQPTNCGISAMSSPVDLHPSAICAHVRAPENGPLVFVAVG